MMGPGTVLGGRYRLLREVGTGGMGQVFLAEDAYLHRQVAVKVLRGDLARNPDFVERFRREATAAAKLSHPNVVAIYDVGEEDGASYLVMEYVEGETLQAHLSRNGPIGPERAAYIGAQVAAALEHAHARGVIHRDIKPANILLTRDGTAKVTDFGIARAVSDATVVNTGGLLGSAYYLSPEQARGGYTDEKSDLYSLGVVLYEMVTGQVPFSGDTMVAVAMKHLRERVPDPRELNREVPESLQEVIHRALQKDPGRRCASAAVMRQDLEGLYDRQDRRRRERRRRLRHGLWWSAYLLGALAVLAGGAWAFNAWLNVPVVRVPAVQGKGLAQAEAALRQAGLSYRIAGSRYSSRVGKGKVADQQPAAGEQVKRGRTVNLTVSQGMQLVQVPDLRRVLIQEAEVQIAAAELNLGTEVYRYDPQVPANYVISQSPAAGQRVGTGTDVNLVVSKGNKPGLITLPTFSGMSLAAAESTLEDLGLSQGQVSYQSDPSPQGTVLGQNPAPNSQVPAGSSVDLVVSRGGGIPGPANLQTITVQVPSSFPANTQVLVQVDDQRGMTTVYTGTGQPGQSIRITFQWFGTKGTAFVLLNGQMQSPIPLPAG